MWASAALPHFACRRSGSRGRRGQHGEKRESPLDPWWFRQIGSDVVIILILVVCGSPPQEDYRDDHVKTTGRRTMRLTIIKMGHGSSYIGGRTYDTPDDKGTQFWGSRG